MFLSYITFPFIPKAIVLKQGQEFVSPAKMETNARQERIHDPQCVIRDALPTIFHTQKKTSNWSLIHMLYNPSNIQ